ncbi:hypothetical protein EAL2_c03940 [Peptoclostridium acidaminophilum DSM 3953]|uniref:Uncharacterized protein n=1 Tax=Peptoclostridium acidaminophilum DSM 3953 TaxID=1286171 RepID=W8THQ5_PEPAC|nr:hypothetical protein [Peptoclostridium acidaminophilum]AHM55697.1 hypothetical protein EAL2_c03940 [Peptoclostridium acidaminophilum DSM 3953]
MIIGKKRNEIEIAEDILRRNNIPLLCEYTPWKRFYASAKSTDLEKEYEKLLSIVRDEKNLKKQVKGVQDKKIKLMAKIVLLSRELNENSNDLAEIELEKARLEIENMNEYIDGSFETLENFKFEKEQLNINLLKLTIKHAYESITSDETRLDKVSETIEERRRELDVLRGERDELRGRLDSMYFFMHSVLGGKEMERLDRKFLK